MDVAIRKFSASDARAFYSAVHESVEHVGAWLPWCTADYTLDDAIQWAGSATQTWNDGSDYRFIIQDNTSGEILGSAGINQVVPQHRVGNLGYWVRKSALNSGVCTTAARLVIEFAFKELGFQRIEIHVHPDNHGSNKVAQRLGGLDEGLFRNKLILNGITGPARCYSVVPGDYSDLPQPG